MLHRDRQRRRSPTAPRGPSRIARGGSRPHPSTGDP
nr:MAG TPA: hypothetical protein [Caudoviricetes sp.]DAO83255.1 MAG TPA: hypothetical protein [Caudoviricetes sp.]DAX73708.1 MAG TPA: hypothetical protein [Caudoviricetes sp.]